MSSFEVKVRKVKVEPHPNADRLELAQVDGFRAVVGKGQFSTGDLAVYIPTGAVVPEDILKKINLWDDEKGKGRLAGKGGNRVKEAKLRGFLSEGIVCSLSILGFPVTEGEDVAEELGIIKWVPPIPVHLAGEVENAFGYTLNYDIENFKKYPDVLVEGEVVVFTEKIHGTFCCLGYNADYENEHVVSSKGLSSSGLALKINEANKDNLYVKQHLATLDNGVSLAAKVASKYNETAAYLLGEVFGTGVQDLKYGMDSPTFRLFDVYIGQPGKGRYLDYNEMIATAIFVGLPTVPRLYQGPFTIERMEEYTSGMESVSGTDACIREGIVIKPLVERRDEMLGRVILKSVSEAYLCRKGNTTEFN